MAGRNHYITVEAQRIMERFPEVYGPPPWSIKKTSLAWGFACGEGWYPLIERLSADLADIIREDGLTRFRAQQVKQKLGELRFYARGGNERTAHRIAQAQMEAAKTCEHCGTRSAQKQSLGGWLTTTCDACAVRLLRSRS